MKAHVDLPSRGRYQHPMRIPALGLALAASVPLLAEDPKPKPDPKETIASLMEKAGQGKVAVAMLAEDGFDLVPGRPGRPDEARDMGFLDFTHPSCPNTPPPRTTGWPDGYISGALYGSPNRIT